MGSCDDGRGSVPANKSRDLRRRDTGPIPTGIHDQKPADRMSAPGRFLPNAPQQGERRLLRVKRTPDNYFLCFDKLLKTANSGPTRCKKKPALKRVPDVALSIVFRVLYAISSLIAILADGINRV